MNSLTSFLEISRKFFNYSDTVLSIFYTWFAKPSQKPAIPHRSQPWRLASCGSQLPASPGNTRPGLREAHLWMASGWLKP